MALTLSAVSGAHHVVGNKRARVYDVTFDSTYPDNGEALTPTNVGLRKIEQLIPHGPFRNSDGSDALLVSWDRTNQKLLAYVGTGTAQNRLPENTTADISAYSGRVTFIGY
jgi:hypothetical protein